jgi:hypothetical protein
MIFGKSNIEKRLLRQIEEAKAALPKIDFCWIPVVLENGKTAWLEDVIWWDRDYFIHKGTIKINYFENEFIFYLLSDYPKDIVEERTKEFTLYIEKLEKELERIRKD